MAFLSDRYVRCLLLSAVVHVAVFGTYKIGKDQGWFISPKFTFLQKVLTPKKIKLPSLPLQKELQKQLQLQSQPPAELVFVEVDPRQAPIEPPKESKFYGAVSTRAENPEPKKAEEKPELKGTETKVARVLEPSQTPRNLTPTPPPPPKVEEKPKTSVPPPQIAKVEPKVQEIKPPPPKLEPKPPPKIEPKAETKLPTEKKVSEPVKPPVQVAVARPVPQKVVTPQQNQPNISEPPRRRPRRLDEVRQPNSSGESMKQQGGTARLAMRANMDVRGTITGDYDSRFIRAVEQRWFSLLDGRTTTIPGEVVVEFRLRHDGRIENLRVLSNSAGEILGLICEKAILDPAPYDRWPLEMRNELRQDYRDVKFTFHYLLR